jgi:hypothetical protein
MTDTLACQAETKRRYPEMEARVHKARGMKARGTLWKLRGLRMLLRLRRWALRSQSKAEHRQPTMSRSTTSCTGSQVIECRADLQCTVRYMAKFKALCYAQFDCSRLASTSNCIQESVELIMTNLYKLSPC